MVLKLLYYCIAQVDHYSSDGTMQHQFLVLDPIFKFHKSGFDTCAVVCDGASSNLTMVKEMSGASRKAYGYVLLYYLYDGIDELFESTGLIVQTMIQ